MSEILALGVSHHTAPVELRERVSLSDARAKEFLGALLSQEAVTEGVVISTCNRTEVHLVGTDAVEAETAALTLLSRHAGIRPTELSSSIYSLRNCDAARHLFRVAAGLDSMVLGEAEVQGQVRRAYDLALAAGTTGPLTNRLFRAALEAGKRVRSQTGIGDRRVSVTTVAVELARDTVGDLSRRAVIVIGAGETSERTAQALADQGVTTIFIANRNADRARALADRFGGAVGSLDQLPDRLLEADIVVASTSSPHSLIGAEELELVMQGRNRRPLVLIDIAVPRDIEPECAEVEGVALYDIDDLQAVVMRNLEVRASERANAEAVVEEEIQRFARWMAQLDVVPTITALREHGTGIVDQVLAENAGRWESASARDLARIEAVARAVMQRLLHEPTLRLKGVDGEAGGHGRQQLLRELFGLEEGAEPADMPPGDAPSADVRPLRRA